MSSTATDNNAIAAALQALAAAVSALRPAAVPPKVYDPFASTEAFDLSSRSGSSAYAKISSPLDTLWEGDVSTFPSFVVLLRIRAREGKWNSLGDEGILTLAGRNILTEYHSISDADIETARIARTNDRAIQNSKAMYNCIKSSITGDIRDTIFTQLDNMPENEDGVALFKKVTTLTTVSSLQLSLLSFNNILNFNPVDHGFNIPILNSKLLHLFVLATTSTRNLLDSERIQHTLNVYGKILQPEVWAQWVRNKVEDFEEGKITKCQDFMNTATIKYNKIAGSYPSGKFPGSSTTVQEDIVAMISLKNKRKYVPKDNNDDNESKRPSYDRDTEKPPFLTHSQDSSKTKYKLGNTKMWKGKAYYFCNCPIHRNCLK